eukprot:Lankesteria_metandrocarpae@DN1027_c0_g1_i1.p1
MAVRGKASTEKRRKERKEWENQNLEKLVREATCAKTKNRLVRRLLRQNKDFKTKRRKDRLEREAHGEKPNIKPAKTIENMRKPNVAIIGPQDREELSREDSVDEFASYFANQQTPKIMITTVRTIRPSKGTVAFLKEFLLVFPNTYYYKRMNKSFIKVAKYATKHGFTDVIVFNQWKGLPSGLYLSHLPEGPTSYFRLTGLKMAQDFKSGGVLTDHRPEIIMNNFTTHLGHRIGRHLASLFPQSPEFEGRRVMTFHNQRDFVFFRHHRYVFKKESERVCGKKAKVRRDSRKTRRLQVDLARHSDTNQHGREERGDDQHDTHDDNSDDTLDDDSDDTLDDDGDAANSSSRTLSSTATAAGNNGGAAMSAVEDWRVRAAAVAGVDPIKCQLKEIGPRFTLKLRSIQLGVLDDEGGGDDNHFEFIWRADSQSDRKIHFM